MRGSFDLMVRALFEIIVLIVIIILLVYAVQSIGLLSNFEDSKYISLVKFIESSINQLQIGEERTWGDYVTYNPVKYSIVFNYTDGRIYLYKCDSPELKVVFSNVSGTMAKDLAETNCYPIYSSGEVLNNAVIVNISGGTEEISEGSKVKTIVLKLYDLNYSEFSYTDPETGAIYYQSGLIINNVYDNVNITSESNVTDVSSYLFGLASSVSEGVTISSDCEYTDNYVECVVDAKQLLRNGKLVMPDITVSVIKTEQYTIINFKPTI